MKRTLFLPFCILIDIVASQSIIKSPKDKTGGIGETAKFVCEVDYGEHFPTITWKFNNTIIYFYMDDMVDYPLGTNKYIVTHSHTIFTLEVRNLNYTDAGNYICEVIGQKKSADLVVLGTPIITQETTNLIEGKTALFTCKARFGGPSTDKLSHDHFPQLQLVLDDIIYQETSHSQNDFLIRKVYEIPLDDSMDSKDLKCKIGTTQSKHLISSTKLNVQYSVRNVTYSPKDDKYIFGTNITCSARGNPVPLFEWRNKAHPEIVIKGQLLNITDDMEGRNSWTCTARNAVGGEMYEDEITANFKAASTFDGNLQDKVLYRVRNVTYSPQYPKYVFGSNITCSAQGNPTPLFEWRNRANPEIIIKGQLLHITDDMVGRNSWTCTARNSVDGRMYEDEVTAKFEAAFEIEDYILQSIAVWSGVAVICSVVGCLIGIIGLKAYQTIQSGSRSSQKDEEKCLSQSIKGPDCDDSQEELLKTRRNTGEGSTQNSSSTETSPVAVKICS